MSNPWQAATESLQARLLLQGPQQQRQQQQRQQQRGCRLWRCRHLGRICHRSLRWAGCLTSQQRRMQAVRMRAASRVLQKGRSLRQPSRNRSCSGPHSSCPQRQHRGCPSSCCTSTLVMPQPWQVGQPALAAAALGQEHRSSSASRARCSWTCRHPWSSLQQQQSSPVRTPRMRARGGTSRCCRLQSVSRLGWPPAAVPARVLAAPGRLARRCSRQRGGVRRRPISWTSCWPASSARWAPGGDQGVRWWAQERWPPASWTQGAQTCRAARGLSCFPRRTGRCAVGSQHALRDA